MFTSKTGNTFLNIGARYPNQTFTGWTPPASPMSKVGHRVKKDYSQEQTALGQRDAPARISRVPNVGSRTGNLLALARRALVASQRCAGSSFKIECSRLTTRGFHRS
jgi:hypothetical protein